jgi:hypothetical protein
MLLVLRLRILYQVYRVRAEPQDLKLVRVKRGVGTVFLMEGVGLHTAFTTEEEDVIWSITETSQEWTGDMTSWTKEEAVDKQITEI